MIAYLMTLCHRWQWLRARTPDFMQFKHNGEAKPHHHKFVEHSTTYAVPKRMPDYYEKKKKIKYKIVIVEFGDFPLRNDREKR